MKKTGEEDNKSFSEEVEKIKEEKIKESGWRYMGGNWGWLSLFSFALTFLLNFGFKMEKVALLAALVSVFGIFMLVGAKDFFLKP